MMLLQRGNNKLDRTIFNWSISPVKSCLNHNKCYNTCYAVKTERLYKSAKKAWARNFELAKTGKFKDIIIKQLSNARICETVRIHVAGDFFSEKYIEDWFDIALLFPEIQFYSYSKVFDILNVDRLNELFNVNIINSICFDGEINYGNKDRIKFLTDNGYILCPVTIPENKTKNIICGIDCRICLYHDKICFHKH